MALDRGHIPNSQTPLNKRHEFAVVIVYFLDAASFARTDPVHSDWIITFDEWEGTEVPLQLRKEVGGNLPPGSQVKSST